MKNKYYSQKGQDKFLNQVFFRGKKNQFFIDIGANDGVSFSNSCFFEKTLGWRGVCVEPIPEIFKKLQINRNCILENACISNENGELSFTRVKGYGEMLSGITDQYDPAHKIRIKETIKEHGGEIEHIIVKSISLKSLIKKHNIMRIDFVSIDTEGNEWQIISSFPFDIIKPKIFLVENNYNDTRIHNFLVSKGYCFCINLGDDVFHLGSLSLFDSVSLFFFKSIRYFKYKFSKYRSKLQN